GRAGTRRVRGLTGRQTGRDHGTGRSSILRGSAVPSGVQEPAECATSALSGVPASLARRAAGRKPANASLPERGGQSDRASVGGRERIDASGTGSHPTILFQDQLP